MPYMEEMHMHSVSEHFSSLYVLQHESLNLVVNEHKGAELLEQ